MDLIIQTDRCGCGPACLAMITGMTYAEAKAHWPKVDFKKTGLSRVAMDRVLANLGYAVCRRELARRPFGQIHLVETQTKRNVDKKQGWHWCTMDADGVCYDPIDGIVSLENYYHIRAVAAVVKVVAPEDVFYEVKL